MDPQGPLFFEAPAVFMGVRTQVLSRTGEVLDFAPLWMRDLCCIFFFRTWHKDVDARTSLPAASEELFESHQVCLDRSMWVFIPAMVVFKTGRVRLAEMWEFPKSVALR